MRNKNLIVLAGRKGSGKDTAAEALVSQGYEVVKFAGALKAMLRTFLEYVNVPSAEIERAIEGDLKEFPLNRLGGQTMRYAMQTLGTEWGRDLIHQDIWVNACVDRCQALLRSGKKVVVTDARYENEVNALRNIDARIYRIVRPSSIAVDPHPSEAFIDRLRADAAFVNDSTIPALHKQLLDLVNS